MKTRYFILFPLLFIAAAFFFAWVVMLLWNAILPDVLHVGTLTYWQALGLLVLCRILFGGFRGPGRNGRGGGPAKWRGKWMSMNAEEKERFRAEWEERCKKSEE